MPTNENVGSTIFTPCKSLFCFKLLMPIIWGTTFLLHSPHQTMVMQHASMLIICNETVEARMQREKGKKYTWVVQWLELTTKKKDVLWETRSEKKKGIKKSARHKKPSQRPERKINKWSQDATPQTQDSYSFTIIPKILFPYHLPCQSCIFNFTEKRKDIVPNPERNECRIECRY